PPAGTAYGGRASRRPVGLGLASAEVANAGPHDQPRPPRVPADPDRAALLAVVQALAVVHPVGDGAAGEQRTQPLLGVADHDRDGGGVGWDGPFGVGVVPAIGRGQPVPPAVPFDRAGLAVVA